MGTVPEALQVVFLAWASGFSKSVFPNFVTLVLGAMLTTGRRTVSHILLTIGELYRERPRLTQTPPPSLPRWFLGLCTTGSNCDLVVRKP